VLVPSRNFLETNLGTDVSGLIAIKPQATIAVRGEHCSALVIDLTLAWYESSRVDVANEVSMEIL
jgi:hypothetical protein